MKNPLVSARESEATTLINNIEELPELPDGVTKLRDSVESENPADFKVPFSSVVMDTSGYIRFGETQMVYTKHALSQAVYRIKPDGVVGLAGYLAACPPDLRYTNYSFWHDNFYGPHAEVNKDKDVLLRVRTTPESDIMLRAVLGQQYVPIDDLSILSTLVDVMEPGGHLSSARGDMVSRFTVMWPNKQFKLVNGETLAAGVRIANSETGASSVKMDLMFHTNEQYGITTGFIIPSYKNANIRHVGEATRKLSDRYRYIMANLDEFVMAFNGATADSFNIRFKNIEETIDAVGYTFDLPAEVVHAIKSKFDPNDTGHTTRYKIVMTMSSVANDLQLDVGELVQKAAGTLVLRGWKCLTNKPVKENDDE